MRAQEMQRFCESDAGTRWCQLRGSVESVGCGGVRGFVGAVAGGWSADDFVVVVVGHLAGVGGAVSAEVGGDVGDVSDADDVEAVGSGRAPGVIAVEVLRVGGGGGEEDIGVSEVGGGCLFVDGVDRADVAVGSESAGGGDSDVAGRSRRPVTASPSCQ